MRAIYIVLLIFGSFLFFILVIAKIARKLYPFPVPNCLTEIIDNPWRRILQPPKKIIDRMKVLPGMKGLEIGPGKGSYLFEFAQEITPGTVRAIDISEKVITRLKKRITERNIPNIELQVQDAITIPFDDNTFDRILSIACLPEIPYPIQALSEWKRVLKSDGIISLCELFFDPDYPLRTTEIRWAKEVGLYLQDQFGSWFAYQLNFTKFE